MKFTNPWRDKTRRRMRKLASADLLEWGNQSIVASWRAAEQFASATGDRADLDEALKEAGVYYAILEEMRDRDDAENRAF